MLFFCNRKLMFDTEKYREIRDFLKKTNKNSEIIAISKNHPKESVVEAINEGVRIFGENRVLEAKNKFEDLKREYNQIELHLTGPLQSNKVKLATLIFDVFHTLDREKIAIEFSKNKDNLKNKKIFIQVNTGEEKTKSGIFVKDLSEFLNFCKNDMHLKINGLMCIPPLDENPNKHFIMLNKILKKTGLKGLSIGMSADYLDALNFNPIYKKAFPSSEILLCNSVSQINTGFIYLKDAI